MSATTKTATHESELERLRSEKQRLSLDVINGPNKKAARAELATIVTAIAELESEIELAALAIVEQQRRERIAEQQRETERRAGLETELVTLTATRDEVRAGFVARLGELLDAVRVLYHAERAVYGKSTELGQNPRWKARDNISREIRTALGPELGWEGFDYVPMMHRTKDGKMPEARTIEWVSCQTCGGLSPTGAKHHCSIAHCERCLKAYDKHSDHRCEVSDLLEPQPTERRASIPLIVEPSPTDTHQVVKQFEGPGGRRYQQGEPVDASEWRNTATLVRGGFLRLLTSADKSAATVATTATEAQQ